MKTFKGTKTWHIKPSLTDDRHIDICIGEYYSNVADIRIFGTDREANAKLIAAAPELLEALQELMKEYESKGQLLGFDIDIARKALNKAL